MTQAEFDKQDEQAMRVANRVPTAGKNAMTESQATENSCSGQSNRAEKIRRHLWTGLRVTICAVIAALLLVAMVDPNMVVHLANLGILSCGITAAIIIDRHFRR